MAFDDLAGRQFGYWSVLYRSTDAVDGKERRYTTWHCRCICGEERDVLASSLKRGLSKSCGCIHKLGDKNSTTQDLTGKQYGRWTVIARVDDYIKPSGKHVPQWRCRCICGNEGIVSGENLKSGHSLSCGCLAKEVNSKRRLDNLSGKRFGRLTVKYRVDDYKQPNGNKHPVWHCVCDCGNELDVSGPNLRCGDTNSCGCLKRELASQRQLIDLTGQKYGRLTVISRAEDYVSPTGLATPRWKCRCDCGNAVVVHGNNLRHGKTLSCGCYRAERISERSLDDLSGKVFGKLTVLSRAKDRVSKSGTRAVMWRCKCECGKTTAVSAGALKDGRQITCGCSHKKSIEWLDGTVFESEKDMCNALGVDYTIVSRRLRDGWSLEESVKAPKNLSLGEYRIRSILDDLSIKHIDNVSIKTLLIKELGYSEKQYHEFLDSYMITMQREHLNISKRRIAQFRFDFSLIRNNDLFAFIECDGQQHFQFVYAFFESLAEFLDRCVCDRTKTVLAECKGIPLLRIRYDQLEEYKLRYMIQDLLSNPQKYVYRHNTFLSEEEYWKPLNDGVWSVSTQLGHVSDYDFFDWKTSS